MTIISDKEEGRKKEEKEIKNPVESRVKERE